MSGVTAEITRTAVRDNEAASGGGIYAVGFEGAPSSLTIADTTIAQNVANDGGGLSISGGGHAIATLVRTTFSNNSASSGGGLNISADIRVANTTISGNTATSTGAAIAYFAVGGSGCTAR